MNNIHNFCISCKNTTAMIVILFMIILQVQASNDSESDLGILGHVIGIISAIPGYILSILGNIFLNFVYSLTEIKWLLPKATIFLDFVTDRTVRLYFDFFIVIVNTIHCWGRLLYVVYYGLKQLLLSIWGIFSNDVQYGLFIPPLKFKEFSSIQQEIDFGNPNQAGDLDSDPVGL